MTRRDDHTTRCDECRMHTTLCICPLVPRLRTRTRVTVMLHHLESRKPSNTGRLAARCLERGAVEIVGQRHRLIESPRIVDEVPLVLFPGDDAVPLTEYATSAQPVALFVPDGNWHQARKMRRRGPGLAAFPCVTLPEPGRTEYRLRAEPWAGGLATMEAIARALAILEGPVHGPAIERAMLGIFRVMVERTLWFRGRLRGEQVAGGIPPAAIRDDPRGQTTRRTALTLDAALDEADEPAG